MLIFPNVVEIEEKKANKIFDKFSPKHEIAGLTFSRRYVAYITGTFKKEYHILSLVTGDTLTKDSYAVEEWCDQFYTFKSNIELQQALAFLYNTIKEKKTTRISIFKDIDNEYKDIDFQKYMKSQNYSLC